MLSIADEPLTEVKQFAPRKLTFRTRKVTDLFLRTTVNLTNVLSGDYKIKITVTDLPSRKKPSVVVPVSIRE